jgi:hypothetical protein
MVRRKERKRERRKLAAKARARGEYMSSSDEYQFSELRKEIDYLIEEVIKLKRLVRNIKDLNRLKLSKTMKTICVRLTNYLWLEYVPT